MIDFLLEQINQVNPFIGLGRNTFFVMADSQEYNDNISTTSAFGKSWSISDQSATHLADTNGICLIHSQLHTCAICIRKASEMKSRHLLIITHF